MNAMDSLKAFKVEHDGIFLGGISIVFAADEDDARLLMSMKLADEKIQPKIFDIEEIPVTRGAVMLWNGDY